MTIRACLTLLCLLAPVLTRPQQAIVNLDYNPQKNTEHLIPFSAPLNSPDARCVALHEALLKHNIMRDYYVGG